MNRTLFTLDDFKVDLLADAIWLARLKFRSLAALMGMTQRTFFVMHELRLTDIQLCVPSTTVVHKNSLLLHIVDRPGAIQILVVDSFHQRTRPGVVASVEEVDHCY